MFVYSCSIKICALGFDKLLESIFCLLLVVEVFLTKSCQDAWRSSSRLARGQVNMADEPKLCSPISSTFEPLVVWYAVEHCHGEELDPFYWSTPAAGIAVFQCISSIYWVYFSDVMVLPDSENCSGSYGQQTTKQQPWFFWCFLLELLLRPATELIIAGCQYKIHFSLHITILWRNGLLL